MDITGGINENYCKRRLEGVEFLRPGLHVRLRYGGFLQIRDRMLFQTFPRRKDL